MNKTFSLQDVTAKLAQEFAAQGIPEEFQETSLKARELSEQEAYMRLDSLLARLHKDHENAAAYHDKLVRDLGADDPMTAVSEDMAESALSAFETRLIELKSDTDIARKVARMTCPEMQLEKVRRAKRLKRHRMALNMNRLRQDMIAKLRKDSEEQFFFMLIMMHIFKIGLEHLNYNFSLVGSFSYANCAPRQEFAHVSGSGSG